MNRHDRELLEACPLSLIQFGANEDYSDDNREAVNLLRSAIQKATNVSS
jgi:hypothetical protein